MKQVKVQKSSTLGNILLLLGSLVLAFCICEIAVRVMYGAPPRWLKPQVSHVVTSYGYKMTPHQRSFNADQPVITNAFGFRDREWEVPKPPEKIRIMALGDSLTFGVRVRGEDIFANRLESKIKKINKNYEVLPAAAVGWDTYHELDLFRDEGLNCEPDLVILCFYANDYTRRKPFQKERLVAVGRVDERPYYIRWLSYDYIYFVKRSAFIYFLRMQMDNVFSNYNKDLPNKIMDNEIDLDHDLRVKATYSYIKEMIELLHSRQIPLIVAHLPPAGLLLRGKRTAKYIGHLQAFVESQGAEFIDLTPWFIKIPHMDSYYNVPWDYHFSPAGHEAAAEGLFQAIQPWVRSR